MAAPAVALGTLACAGLALVAAVGLGGCLYVDSINHPPVADLRFSYLPLQTPLLEHAVELDASGSTDPDDGDTETLAYEWHVDGEIALESVPPLVDAAAPAPGDGGLPGGPRYCFQTVGETTGVAKARVTFHLPGVHTVEVVAIDRHGARSKAVSAQLTLVDAPPTAAITVNANRSGCGDYPALGYVNLVALATDADAAPAGSPCWGPLDGETLSYYWHVTARPNASKAAWLREGPCTGPDGTPGLLEVPTGALAGSPSAGSVCFEPDVPGSYTVELVVYDGKGQTGTAHVDLPVAADRPPCMDDFEPAVSATAVIPLLQTDSQTLRVTSWSDDLDGPGTGRSRFAWSIWRSSDPAGWRPLMNDDQTSFVVDGASFSLGEEVRVRVAPGDRQGFPSTMQCGIDMPLCPLTGPTCNPNVECEAWATWILRVR